MRKFIYIISIIVLLIALVTPYILEFVSRKHIMFSRYLVTKQYLFADSQFIVYGKYAAVVFLIVAILALVLEVKKRKVKNILYCHSLMAVLGALIFLSVINIEPLSTIRFYMLLISGIVFLCVSFFMSALLLTEK